MAVINFLAYSKTYVYIVCQQKDGRESLERRASLVKFLNDEYSFTASVKEVLADFVQKGMEGVREKVLSQDRKLMLLADDFLFLGRKYEQDLAERAKKKEWKKYGLNCSSEQWYQIIEEIRLALESNSKGKSPAVIEVSACQSSASNVFEQLQKQQEKAFAEMKKKAIYFRQVAQQAQTELKQVKEQLALVLQDPDRQKILSFNQGIAELHRELQGMKRQEELLTDQLFRERDRCTGFRNMCDGFRKSSQLELELLKKSWDQLAVMPHTSEVIEQRQVVQQLIAMKEDIAVRQQAAEEVLETGGTEIGFLQRIPKYSAGTGFKMEYTRKFKQQLAELLEKDQKSYEELLRALELLSRVEKHDSFRTYIPKKQIGTFPKGAKFSFCGKILQFVWRKDRDVKKYTFLGIYFSS